MNPLVKYRLANDLLASVVVFLVALPLCMGIAIASGVPPAMGLMTGIIGGLVVGAIAGSPLQVSGPAAGLSVLVFELVRDKGLEALGVILILAGAIQLTAGALKVGGWFRAISPAVIYGMLAGIGVLILASQFHVMVDDKPRANGLLNLISIPESIIKGFTPEQGLPHNEAAALGLLTIITMILWAKFAPSRLSMIPGALVAVMLASGVALLFRLPVNYVNVPSNLLDAVRLPSDWGRFADLGIIGSAFALAFVASAETLLSAAAVDRMHHGPRTKYDRELAAQGVGNLLCGFVGALPMTGVIVRSATNVNAGAKTRASAMFHGVWLLAAVVALPQMLRMIPVSALAGILVYTGYKLVDIRNIRHLQKYGRMPVFIYAATVIGIVATDLLTGVLIGIGLSVLKLLYKVSHLDVRLEIAGPHRADLYLEGAATFLKLPKLASVLDKVPQGAELHLHVPRLVYIDHTCLDLLNNWREQQRMFGSELVVEWDGLLDRFRKPMAGPPELFRQSEAVAH